MARSRPLLLAVVLVLLYLAIAVAPAWLGLFGDTRDFATFYAAVTVWQQGGDPYAFAQLQEAAPRGTTVYPFFYPPPALPLLAWIGLLPLQAGYRAMFLLNQLALVGVMAVLWRWFRPPAWLLWLSAVTWVPVAWSGRMGQVNVVVLLLLLLGAWRSRGGALALAALIKLSPALLAGRWLADRAWRPVLASIAVYVGAHLLVLPWVGPDLQARFYLEVLPQFASGAYNGLQVPISLPANHSLANLFDQLWPGPGDNQLSAPARHATRGVVLAATAGLLWMGRRRLDPLGEALLIGALLVVMVLAPVFAYEHHLVFLLPSVVAAGTALQRGRLPRAGLVLLVIAWVALALPIEWFRAAQASWPEGAVLVRESKLVGALLLGALCAWGAARSPAAPA